MGLAERRASEETRPRPRTQHHREKVPEHELKPLVSTFRLINSHAMVCVSL